jgi:hypothetical protein
MAALPILNQQKGPLPIKIEFSSPTDAPATIMVTGSVWSQTANVIIGIEVYIDGKPIGSSSIYSNLQATHRATVATYIPVTIPFGPHQLALEPLNANTVSDINDFFDAVLMY